MSKPSHSIFCRCTMAVLIPVVAALLTSCTVHSKVEPAEANAILPIAEKFLRACSASDLPKLKAMTSMPFFVAAPCHGGSFESLEELMESLVWEPCLDVIPKTYMRRVVLTPDEYAHRLSPNAAHKEANQSFVKFFGPDGYIACLYGEDETGLAVFVRFHNNDVRVIGMGMLPPC